MLVRDEPAVIDLAQDAGAATASGSFLTTDEALPTKLVATCGHVMSNDGPLDVVKAKDLVLDQLESLLECPLRLCLAHKRVLCENEHSFLGDTWRDLIPRMRVELFDVGRESSFVVHESFSR